MNEIQVTEWFHFVQRDIHNKVVNLFHNLNPWEILFLYWESWVGKTTIMDALFTSNDVTASHSKFLSWEWKNNIDNPRSWILEFLKAFGFLNESVFSLTVRQSIENLNNNDFSNYHQTIKFNTSFDNIPSQIVQKLIFEAFRTYSRPYIFFDAVENLMNMDEKKSNNDKIILLKILNILSQNGIKIILSSRNFEDINRLIAPIISIEIEKFTYREFETYLELNIPILSETHKRTIKNLCKYFDSHTQERYELISLSLLYTLYVNHTSHFFDLLEEVSKTGIENINTLFELGERNVCQWIFQHEVKTLLLKKIFWLNPVLLDYLKKTFLIKYHHKESLTSYTIAISDSEWQAFENFIAINGRTIMKSTLASSKSQLVIHDSIYHLIVPYFQHKIKINLEEYLQYISWYFHIFIDWCDNRISSWIPLQIIKQTLEICKIEIKKMISPIEFSRFLMSYWLVLRWVGDYYEAIEQYKFSLSIITQLPNDNRSSLYCDEDIVSLNLNLWVAYMSVKNYSQAIEYYSSVFSYLNLQRRQQHNNNLTIKYDLAKTHLNYWLALLSIWDFNHAILQYKKSLKIYISLWTNFQSNQFSLAKLYLNLWWGYWALWRYKDSIRYYNLSMEILYELLNTQKDSIEIKSNISKVLFNLWVELNSIKDYLGAFSALQRCLDIRLEIQKFDIDNSTIEEEIAKVDLELWETLLNLWEPQKALIKFEKSLEISLNRFEFEPDNQTIIRETAKIYYYYWIAHLKNRNLAEFSEYSEKSMILYNQLLWLNPLEQSILNDKALAISLIATALMDEWYIEFAMKQFKISQKIFTDIERNDTINLGIKNHLAKIHMSLWYLMLENWELDNSIQESNLAIEKFLELISQRYDKNALYYHFATLYFNLWNAYMNKGVLEESMYNYKKSIKYFQNSLSYDLINSSHLRDMGKVYLNLGWILWEMWEFKKSFSNFIKCQDLFIKLSQSEPTNNNYKKDLAMLYMNLWVILDCLWKYNESILKYNESKRIYIKLIRHNNEDPYLKHELAKVFLNMGNAFHGTNELTKSIKTYNKARTIWRQLLKVLPSDEEFNNYLLATIDNTQKVKSLLDNKFNGWLPNT